MILVDSNIILDVVTGDKIWAAWSLSALANAADRLAINDVIYSEVSVRYARIEDLDAALEDMEITLHSIPKAGLFLAGKVFQRYREAGGARTGVLPDFFIGAHASVANLRILTRDVQRYRTYFPRLQLISPP